MAVSGAEQAEFSQAEERVVVLGLGNTILSDDGLGIRAAQALERRLVGEQVTVRDLSWGGFAILDELAGFDWAILIDAIVTGQSEPGTITQWAVPETCRSPRIVSYHDMGFFTALELGRMLGLDMPQRISLFTVEALDIETVSERLTPCVAQSLDPLVEEILQTLDRGGALRATAAASALAGVHI